LLAGASFFFTPLSLVATVSVFLSSLLLVDELVLEVLVGDFGATPPGITGRPVGTIVVLMRLIVELIVCVTGVFSCVDAVGSTALQPAIVGVVTHVLTAGNTTLQP
jgi:hypothetical protein